MMAHPNYDDFWKARNTLPHFHNVRPAVLTVGGWFDAEDLYGALKTYESIERKNPGLQNRLVMGPWCHGCWSRTDGDRLGDVRVRLEDGRVLPQRNRAALLRVRAQGQVRREAARGLRLRDGHEPLAQVRQVAAEERQAAQSLPGRRRPPLFRAGRGATRGYDEYVSDPARPVPHINVVNIGMTNDYMIQDQRFASRRPDVLVYQTAPLKDDLTVAGPVTASLFVSTSGTDSDFVVKLIDVFPDDAPDPEPNDTKLVHWGGYQMLVRGEPMRARFRNAYERPEAMAPNQPTRLEFVMPDASHTFRKGHRVMVQIQSSWFPLVDRNPQKFVDINRAREADFQKATQRVYHAPRLRSAVRLTVLP